MLLHRRPDKGLLGGMLCFPSSGWDAANDSALPETLPDQWTALDGTVVHVFTHFRLTLKMQAQNAPKKGKAVFAIKQNMKQIIARATRESMLNVRYLPTPLWSPFIWLVTLMRGEPETETNACAGPDTSGDELKCRARRICPANYWPN